MLTKDKKPDEKEGKGAAVVVIPARPETPKMFKAALKVTEQAGIEGTFAKIKAAYKPAEADEDSSAPPRPPPSPMHRRTPVPVFRSEEHDDTVAETADSSLIIRMTPRREGEEMLSVEVSPAGGDGDPGAEK